MLFTTRLPKLAQDVSRYGRSTSIISSMLSTTTVNPPKIERYKMYEGGVTTKTNKIPSEQIRVTLALDSVNHDIGLSTFLKDTYLATGLGVGSSIGLALAADYSGIASQYPGMCFGLGIVGAICGVLGMSATKYDIWKSKYGLTSTNSVERKISFTALTAGMGLTMAPTVSMVAEISPMILPVSVALSFATMGGASLYAYKSENAKLLTLKAPLMGALTGLVGVSLMALGSSLLFGNNMFTQMLHSVDLYGGIALFTALTAYDTHVAIDKYEKGDPDHLGCATDFYLDFMNLLVRFMELVAKVKKHN